MKKILVVVDMQNDFITGPLGTPEAVSIVDKVVEKIRGEEWDGIIRTMDTHYSHSYFSSQEGRKLQIKHCMLDTDGWYSNDDIRVAIQEACFYISEYDGYIAGEIVRKTSFGSVDLINTIFKYGSHNDLSDIELTLVGVCTDICVISNALLLKAHYPEMKIVVDASCCAGSTPEKHRMALEVMKSCQVDVVNEFPSYTEYYKALHREPYDITVGKIEVAYSKESEE